MRKKALFGVVASLLVLGFMSLAPSAEACEKCNFIPFVGYFCSPVGAWEVGAEGCVETTFGCREQGFFCTVITVNGRPQI